MTTPANTVPAAVPTAVPAAAAPAPANGATIAPAAPVPAQALTLEQVKALMEANNKALLEQLQKPKPKAVDPNEDPQITGLRNAIAVMHQANMAGLSDAHKQLVASLAGDDVIRQVEVFASLKQAGLVGAATVPVTPVTATPTAPVVTPAAATAPGASTSPHAATSTLNLGGGNTKPQTLAEADAAFIQAIAAKRR